VLNVEKLFSPDILNRGQGTASARP